MATKPTVRIPDWASTGTKVDPGAGQEAAGWDAGDRPPAHWWNWILGAVGEWLDYADTAIDEKLDLAGGTMTGSVTVPVAPGVPALLATSTSGSTRDLYSGFTSTPHAIRFTADNNGFSFMHGCRWVDGTGFVDMGGAGNPAAIRFDLYLGNIHFYRGTISGGAFSEEVLLNLNEVAPGVTLPNMITNRCSTKASSLVTVSGGAGTHSGNAFGFTSSITVTNPNVIITLDHPMVSTAYEAQVTNASGTKQVLSATVTTASTISVRGWDDSGALDPTSDGMVFYIEAKGTQA